MDEFYWFLFGGPEAALSVVFVVVALPLAVIVAIFKSITKRR